MMDRNSFERWIKCTQYYSEINQKDFDVANEGYFFIRINFMGITATKVVHYLYDAPSTVTTKNNFDDWVYLSKYHL